LKIKNEVKKKKLKLEKKRIVFIDLDKEKNMVFGMKKDFLNFNENGREY
jgi:hypothetical protein